MWNGPVNGDWSTCDFTKPPFTNGVMTLSHDEVLFVQETVKPFVEEKPYDDFYIVSEYNKAVNYEKGINIDTYAVIKGYDPTINTLGINEGGIVVEVVEAPSEEV